jgi:iron complex transport system substrate-binding protein
VFVSRIAAALVLALLCAITSVRAEPVVLIDDRGVTVRLAAPATRVITLAPHLTEIAYAAGAGQKLVGVARYSDFPDAARHLPRIGDAARVDIERILMLGPDLVLAWKSGNQAGDIARLERLGYMVFVTEPARLFDVPRIIRSVGVLTGTTGVARGVAAAFESEIESLRTKFSGGRNVPVFYEIWHRPLLTVNGAHMISDVLLLCGGVNVFAHTPVLTPAVSMEAVLAAQPEAIVGGSSAVDAQKFSAQWRSYRIPALNNLPLVYVSPDEIQRATPRIAAGARAVCAGLEKVRTKRR